MTSTTQPTISTLAFRLTAQGVLGHVISGNHTRARALLQEMSADHRHALTAAANTVAELAQISNTVREEHMQQLEPPRFPTSLKVWFGAVALVALAVLVLAGWAVIALVTHYT